MVGRVRFSSKAAHCPYLVPRFEFNSHPSGMEGLRRQTIRDAYERFSCLLALLLCI